MFLLFPLHKPEKLIIFALVTHILSFSPFLSLFKYISTYIYVDMSVCIYTFVQKSVYISHIV